MLREIRRCPRCGDPHRLEFRPLANPPREFAWWSTCPATGQPVLYQEKVTPCVVGPITNDMIHGVPEVEVQT